MSVPPGGEVLGLAALMRRVFAGEDLGPVAQGFIDRAGRDPADAAALLDLATALFLADNADLARTVQAQALQVRRCYRLARPAAAAPAALRVLALAAPGELAANTPLDFLIEGSDVELDFFYMDADGAAAPPPLADYDLVFTVIGESDANAPLLRRAEALLTGCPRPVLNAPARIARLARTDVAAALRGAPGVVVPHTDRLARADLTAYARARGLPLVVRPVDSHAGHGLARIDEAEALSAYLRDTAGEEFYVMPFVDYRDADGAWRKYRVVLIDGRPYACHMAISNHWMIHYLNAGMRESAAKRAEEARFFERFEEAFAVRHAPALAVLHERIGLDYFGIDCAQTPDGALLVFEVDSALIVHDLDPPDLFPYKPAQMRRVFAAFRDLLGRRAGVRPGP